MAGSFDLGGIGVARILRSSAVVVAIIAVGLLVGASVVATWVHGLVTDTDRYVAAVGPLADDSAVQEAVSAHVTQIVLDELDLQAHARNTVGALTEEPRVPGRAVDLAETQAVEGAQAVERRIGETVSDVVASPAFADLWREANRRAHSQLGAVLTGTHTVVQISGDTVQVDVGAIMAAVRDRLLDQEFTPAEDLPASATSMVVIQSEHVETVQGAFDLLSSVARWLPVAAIAAVAVALSVARRRRRALTAVAASIGLAMMVILLGLVVGRGIYLDALDSRIADPDIATAVFDALVSRLRTSSIVALGAALVIAAAAPTMTRARRERLVSRFRPAASTTPARLPSE